MLTPPWSPRHTALPNSKRGAECKTTQCTWHQVMIRRTPGRGASPPSPAAVTFPLTALPIPAPMLRWSANSACENRRSESPGRAGDDRGGRRAERRWQPRPGALTGLLATRLRSKLGLGCTGESAGQGTVCPELERSPRPPLASKTFFQIAKWMDFPI